MMIFNTFQHNSRTNHNNYPKSLVEISDSDMDNNSICEEVKKRYIIDQTGTQQQRSSLSNWNNNKSDNNFNIIMSPNYSSSSQVNNTGDDYNTKTSSPPSSRKVQPPNPQQEQQLDYSHNDDHSESVNYNHRHNSVRDSTISSYVAKVGNQEPRLLDATLLH